MALARLLPADLQTPCLVVDRDVLKPTLLRWQTARGTTATLRPHAKTHKCPGDRPPPAGTRRGRPDSATVGEAEVFADAGFTDLFIAYPVWAAGFAPRGCARWPSGWSC